MCGNLGPAALFSIVNGGEPEKIKENFSYEALRNDIRYGRNAL